MTANIDPEKIADLVRQCARDIILPYHGTLKEHQKSFKNGNPRNEVTVADAISEEFLSRQIKLLFPDSYILGEEESENNPSVFEYLNDPQKMIWVIDPIDGTSNFIKGSKTFCVIVALVADGKTRMGWIYDVCNDSMAFAQKDKGAFIDGQKVRLSKENPAHDVVTGYAGYKFKDNLKNISTSTLRCSGLEYFRMAKREADFSIYWKMKPWDHLAGTLLMQEAGGYAAQWDGSSYDPADATGGLITAANKKIWQKIRDSIPPQVLKKHNLIT